MEYKQQKFETRKLWALTGIAAIIGKEPDIVGITDLSCSWSKQCPFSEDFYTWVSIQTKKRIVVTIYRDMVIDDDGSLDLAYRLVGYCHFEGVNVLWK